MELAALWVSFVAAAAGIASAVIAWFARGDALKAQEQAAAAQEQAAEAQAEAARSEGRSAAATERLALIQSTIFEGPPWSVSWFGGDTYLLTNDSAVDALDVTIDGQPDDITLSVTDTSPRFVGAKSAFKFMFSDTLATGFERDVVVTWKRPGTDEELVWRHPIPLRPRS